MMHDDFFSKSFDQILGFVLPGLVTLWGLSYFDPTGLGAWFTAAPATETSLGGFFFLTLAAIGFGVFISGVRWLIFQRWLRVFPSSPPFDDLKRTDPGVQQAYEDARHSYYSFHLFYANTLCALPVVFIGWKWTRVPAPSWGYFFLLLVIFAAAELVLLFSARHSLDRFKTRAERILGVVQGGHPKDDQRRLAPRR